MPSLRIIAVVAATGLGLSAVAASSSTSCSGEQQQQVQAQIVAIRASLQSDAASNSKASSVPSSCKAALTFDLSAVSENDGELCANDCVAWIEEVVDVPTCGDEEMLTYQRRMAAYLAQCNEGKKVRLQETEANVAEPSSRLRGLAAELPETRQLGVKGLLDALLVVTLNNAL
ncbi:uncharacterized protein IUM83_02243 [Phytophthora cinnamomi]|uniref:uncharacterized protein n=1 Tax=Phytophthora cinnamomi TaxID=4785 RepID=UPI0035593A18|nr:hypothetical protein IUM83_02243 [Phytophthora cinnamomi]